MSQIILVAETGADIPPELAAQYNIRIVPMHVSFGSTTRDDGTFPSEEVCTYYELTRELPKTSGYADQAPEYAVGRSRAAAVEDGDFEAQEWIAQGARLLPDPVQPGGGDISKEAAAIDQAGGVSAHPPKYRAV